MSHPTFDWPCGELDGETGTITLDNGTILSGTEARRALWFYEEEFSLQLEWQCEVSELQVTGRYSLLTCCCAESESPQMRMRLRAGGAQS